MIILYLLKILIKMKKRIFKLFALFAFVLLCTATKAQSTYSVVFQGADTLSNADTVVKALVVPSNIKSVIFQPVVTRVSGTAAGKVVLLQSLDNVTFMRTDSVTLTNVVTNSAFISKSAPLAPYVQLEFTSSGTTKLWPQLWYYFLKD